MHKDTCQVLIVGAGPVGLVAGLDLAQRGIDVIVLDQRTNFDPLTVRCNHISSRSMEIFRRLGLADEIRAGGFTDGFPHDVSIRLTVTGREMARIKIPSRAGRKAGEQSEDAEWPTLEPPHRMNQIFLEPILQEKAENTQGLRLQFDQEVTHISDLGDRVLAGIRSSKGIKREISSNYLIGCDGGGSLVRKEIGAELEGDAIVQRVQSSFIHAPGLTAMMQAEPCWGILNFNPRRSGTVYSIDNDDRFLVHNYLRPGEAFESVDRDSCLRTILGVPDNFEYQLNRNEDWIGRRLVTNKIAKGCVFLAGDAAHIWVPMGGYGMNAGIADAAGLTWLIDAKLKGWGGNSLLAAYAAERLTITRQVSHFAMETAEAMIKNRAAVPDEIEDDSSEGRAAQNWFGTQTRDLNMPQYCCAGLNYGYYYDNSPIIIYDSMQQPSYSMADYTPSTVPGCRFAHIVMADGTSIYDHLGPGYTLVRTLAGKGAALIEAANQLNIPLAIVDIPTSKLHQHALYLVRPDQHVAWRGQHDPQDSETILQTLCGQLPFQESPIT
ncbi:MAG: FAD-binding protein [Gammaproteobacteria bacterium]|jgi:2-polyprenyl-6-methoxyphenol hydroxylase-like FAD-dependent oxidoreductase|nr:FAD-binding protein [Gammaproteobacteria bacterium]MBT5203841.1 FAD-binding protein [Gammaproteobacteria bacterium]MBT6245983.1 FAD-binding protein [Gammaproteobacteria bacterium]